MMRQAGARFTNRSLSEGAAVLDSSPRHLPHPFVPIRAVVAADLGGLKLVIDATGLFPSVMLDDMLASYFSGSDDELWFTVDDEGPEAAPVAVAYVAPERMTMGTWNMYLIAVHPAHQSRGLGAALVGHIEDTLADRGQRLLLVETSGLPEFERTRAFYLTNGYVEEARVREFYGPGEDKIVFRKVLVRA